MPKFWCINSGYGDGILMIFIFDTFILTWYNAHINFVTKVKTNYTKK